jgi:SAM-dependent methyltransferase
MLRGAVGGLARTLWRASMVGCEPGEHIVRYEMYRRIREATRNLRIGSRVLSVSGSTRLCDRIGARDGVVEANHPEYDIAKLAFPNDDFDAVISDQVLEHIPCDPQVAVDEVRRVLRPGGLAIHTTCFLTPFHGVPAYSGDGGGDYWRFTDHGLRYLHRGYSRVIEADGWGNPWMTVLNALTLTRLPVPEEGWHPLNKLARHNRRSYHYVVWVIAQK